MMTEIIIPKDYNGKDLDKSHKMIQIVRPYIFALNNNANVKLIYMFFV